MEDGILLLTSADGGLLTCISSSDSFISFFLKKTSGKANSEILEQDMTQGVDLPACGFFFFLNPLIMVRDVTLCGGAAPLPYRNAFFFDSKLPLSLIVFDVKNNSKRGEKKAGSIWITIANSATRER